MKGRMEDMQPSRIRLLKFLTAFYVGGTERHAVSLCRALDRARFEMHCACLKRQGEFLRDVEALGIPLVEHEINRLHNCNTIREQWKFARYLKRRRIQIVHTYGFYPNVFAIPAARLARAPAVVASIRDTGDHLTPIRRRVHRLVCGLADAILVNAEAVKERLIAEGYDPEKITVIRNGVDLTPFEQKGNGTRLSRELGLLREAPVVLVLSRLAPLKGLEYFLDAAATVSARFPEARFLIVGEGPLARDGATVHDPYRNALERYAVRRGLGGRVVFTGMRSDVPELLSQVTVSVLPSLSEGLSNTVLESMAAGVPVVATRVGGNPEAVEDGVTGLLVPPRDPGALARAIALLLENRETAARFGQAGRQRVAERFSAARMVRETEAFYLKLLKQAPHEITAAVGGGAR